MKRIFLAAMVASGLAVGCSDKNNSNDEGSNSLKAPPGGTIVDACSAVRCANGPCVVKDGKAVCTGQSPSGGDACTGVVCPNSGSCHVELDNPVCVDPCAAVRCANSACVVVNGIPTCMGRPDAGTQPPLDPPADACAAVRCKDGPCVVVNGQPVCTGTPRPDAGTPDTKTAPAGNTACTTDSECETFIDYCVGGCGVCIAYAKPAPNPTCWPPANAFCLNSCEGKKAICEVGHCVAR